MNALSVSNASRRRHWFAALVSATLVLPLTAQTSSRQEATPETRPTSVPTPQEAERAAAEKDGDKVLMLSPFIVSGETEEGYQAKATVAGTRVRTELKDIGTALQVVTTQFLKDTGATGSQSLLTMTTGTEVGGLYGNFGGNGNGTTVYEQISRPDLNTRIRGLSTADNTRNFEASDIPWDAYNIDTVEIQRGANSVLFGLGSPSGLVNASLRHATFKNSGEISIRYGSQNSARGTLDVNRELIDDELGLRVSFLKDRQNHQQKPAFSDDERVYAALRYEPGFLKRGSARTTVRMNYESGKIHATNPRTMPPTDRITPWFSVLNKQTYDFRDAQVYFPDLPGSGVQLTTSPNFQPAITNLYQGNYAFFENPASGVQTGNFLTPSLFYSGQTYAIGPNGARDGQMASMAAHGLLTIAQTHLYAAQAKLPFAGSYKFQSINDPSIFDFYNKTIDGPNRFTNQDFDAINFNVSQTFWNNRLGFEAVYDRQNYSIEDINPYAGSDIAIMIDINKVLPNGQTNPNVGRPFLHAPTYYGGNGRDSLRESERITGFAELRFDDFMEKSRLTQILGRHVFTGVLSANNHVRDQRGWASSAIVPTGGTVDPNGLVGTALDPYRWFQQVSYIGPSQLGASRPTGITNVSALQRPASASSLTVFNSRWQPSLNPGDAGYVNPAAVWYDSWRRVNSTQSENPANYGGWTQIPVTTLYAETDREQLLTSASKSRDRIDSKVFVWQGYLFNGNLVPMFAWREDRARSFTQLAPTTPYGTYDARSPSFILPDMPFNDISGETKSYSLVAHTPLFIRRHLPKGLDFSAFFNKSENFEPSSGRVDILNNPLAAPSGKTEDYGVIISAWGGRVNLKVTKFEAAATGASYGVTNAWLAGSLVVRAWTMAKRYEAGLTGNPAYAGAGYNIGSVVGGVFVQTPEQRAMQQAAVQATLTSPVITNPKFWEAWNMPIGSNAAMSDFRWQNGYLEPWTAGLGGIWPTGMTATSDNVSEGYEFELYVKPTPNWDITVNAAKTKAVRDKIAGGTTLEFLNELNAFFNSPGGRVHRQSGTSPTPFVDSHWNPHVWVPFQLSQILNGTNNAELRPWRFNVISNYRFKEGILKDVNVGGSYQWQDKVAIGYPAIRANINGTMVDSFDISKPLWGPAEDMLNVWVGYRRKLTDKINWNIQLNVTNAIGKDKLIPINVQPDGRPAAYRIQVGPSWHITNTFQF